MKSTSCIALAAVIFVWIASIDGLHTQQSQLIHYSRVISPKSCPRLRVGPLHMKRQYKQDDMDLGPLSNTELSSHGVFHDSRDVYVSVPEIEVIEDIVVDTYTKQEKILDSVEKLQKRVAQDENEFQEIVKYVYKILPVLSIILSLCGIAFQVFVLYPWHEELSYEFKQLEQAIVQLDRKIEKPLNLNNDLKMELNLKRPTGKTFPRLNSDSKDLSLSMDM